MTTLRRLFQSLLIVLTVSLPTFAQPVRPHVTLIVCPGLTYASVHANPLFYSWQCKMAVGLLSPGNARKPDPLANLYASLYAGDTANTLNPNKDLLMRLITATPGDRVTVVPNASEEEAALVADSAMYLGDRVIVCGLPPIDLRTGEWDRLSVVMIAGPSDWGNEFLTSDTTQQPGLVALRDIAPTVLSFTNIPIPESMSGHVIRWQNGNPDLGAMDRITHLDQQVLLPSMWAWGSISLIALLTSLWSLSKGIILFPRMQRYLLRVMMGTPLALMLAAIPTPIDVWAYGLTILAIALLVGAIPSVTLLMALTAAAIGLDGLAGSPSVARSALSGYWLSGIRFYGIGNEYMGILLGGALVSAYAAARRWPGAIRAPRGQALLGLWFALIVLVLSYPAFGAKAGGAVTAMVTFLPAWLALTCGRRVEWRICALAAVLGFALVFAWAGIASVTGERVTHIQSAATHAAHGDGAYIWHIALRKAKMALRTATVPGVLATYVGFIPAWLLWRRTSLKTRVHEYLAADPAFGSTMRAAIGGSIAALLFNDSGFVPFILIVCSPCMTMLHEMLDARE